MGDPQQPAAAGARGDSPVLRRLAAGEAVSPRVLADQLDVAAAQRPRSERPYVILNMISTLDGRASIAGRSGALSSEADRAVFHSLRAVVDAVMAGAGTVRTERYGRMIPDPETRRWRRERGRSDEPLACVVSGRLALPEDLPLLADPDAHVAILTTSPASLPGVAAHVSYVRAVREGALDLSGALSELRQRFGVDTLLCEGGPYLNAHLLAAGLVDELFLTLAPKLAGAEAAGGEALGIVAGPALEAPIELELLGVLESGSELFLRYGVCA
jgi:riboflavin-specific deaminase-like protein